MAPGTGMAAAAELLEIQLDGLEIPVRLDQLDRWSRSGWGSSRPREAAAPSPAGPPPQQGLGADAGPTASTASAAAQRPGGVEAPPPDPLSDQEVWLSLLEPASRRDLMRLLQAPLLRDRSFGSQLLDSWAGRQMLSEVGTLLTSADGRNTAPLLQATLRSLLQQQREVTILSLLRALPPPTLHLRLESLLTLAERWRRQIEQQSQALAALKDLQLPDRHSRAAPLQERLPQPQRLQLSVPHRQEPLPLELWPGQGVEARHRPWLLVLPGLGGNADQLGWFAGALAQRGWSVVVSQHPGSDGPALKAALDGRIPPPGAESLAIRLQDVEAVLQAHHQGRLPLPGQGLVLVGHSLGGLTALLAAGLQPEHGLAERCREERDHPPTTNPPPPLPRAIVNTPPPPPPP
ncbi:MAG: alpha/beta hydrolase, partial [Cyanobium sp.]